MISNNDDLLVSDNEMRKYINKIIESIRKEVSRAKLVNKLVFDLLNFADKFYCL